MSSCARLATGDALVRTLRVGRSVPKAPTTARENVDGRRGSRLPDVVDVGTGIRWRTVVRGVDRTR